MGRVTELLVDRAHRDKGSGGTMLLQLPRTLAEYLDELVERGAIPPPKLRDGESYPATRANLYSVISASLSNISAEALTSGDKEKLVEDLIREFGLGERTRPVGWQKCGDCGEEFGSAYHLCPTCKSPKIRKGDP